MITKQDAERIIKERQRRLDELSRPEIWDRYTRHMECGEEREFKQSCIDDEIIIEALKPYTSDKPKTQFDRIKAMSIEEMAELLVVYETNMDCYYIYGGNGRRFYDEASAISAQIQYLESEVSE